VDSAKSPTFPSDAFLMALLIFCVVSKHMADHVGKRGGATEDRG
jgi:hypothetical protein